MHTRPLCILALGFLMGILTAYTGNNFMLLPALVFLLWLVRSVRNEKSKIFSYGKLVFYVISFLCGMSRCSMQQEFRLAYEPLLKDGETIVLQGQLEEKEYKNEKYFYYLKNCYLISNIAGDVIIPCNQVIAELETDEVPIGQILVLKGSVSVFSEARNEGNFDEKSFYQSQKIDFKCKDVQIEKRYGKTDKLRETLYQLKQRLKAVYETCMSKEDAGVILQMTLGDKSLMAQEIKELYQRVGISHVLAISGLHISVIGMTLYKLLRKVLGSFTLSGIGAGGFMLVYGCMAGFRPSAVRAIVMFLFMLMAQILGRSYDSLSALGFSAIFLLWENPFLLSYAGFLFSYMAVLGVVLAGKIVLNRFEKKQKIRDSIYSGFSIQLMTLPLTAYFYFEIPFYGMFINFLILPFMSILLFCSLAGGFCGLIWQTGAGWILKPCSWILFFYKKISELFQQLPYAELITGKPPLWKMLLFYTLLAMLLYGIKKQKKVHHYLAVGVALLVFVLYPSKKGMELTILDVGQGDGIYLHTSSGYDLFIDGGSSDIRKAGVYRILPFLKCNGVQKIDYWFVSHTDKDHISGLQELLEAGYPVKNLVLSECAAQDETYEALLSLAENAGTSILFMGYLDTLRLGGANLTCVFPYEHFTTDDKNAASLVLYYEDGIFDGLFTGDIGAEQEKWIAENSGKWLGKNELVFYKAAHHGSKYSNSSALLQAIKPQTAVISCGSNNRYGHPHEEAIERIEDTGAALFYTMNKGQVKIRIGGDGMCIEEMGE